MSDEDDIRIGRIVAFAEREVNDEIETIAEMIEKEIVDYPIGERNIKDCKIIVLLNDLLMRIRARKRSI